MSDHFEIEDMLKRLEASQKGMLQDLKNIRYLLGLHEIPTEPTNNKENEDEKETN